MEMRDNPGKAAPHSLERSEGDIQNSTLHYNKNRIEPRLFKYESTPVSRKNRLFHDLKAVCIWEAFSGQI
jgi:hypothetical protein